MPPLLDVAERVAVCLRSAFMFTPHITMLLLFAATLLFVYVIDMLPAMPLFHVYFHYVSLIFRAFDAAL